MKVRLLFRWRDLPSDQKINYLWERRFSDLEMENILNAMSGGDSFVYDVCRKLLDSPLQCREDVQYRQEILTDCLAHACLIRNMYKLCQETEKKRKHCWYRLTSPHLSAVYTGAVDILKIYMEAMISLRKMTEKETFTSDGLRQFSATLCREFSDDFLDQVASLKSELEETDSILISSGFGNYLQGISYIRRHPNAGFSKLHWFLAPSFTLAEKDLNGATDFEVRRDRAINDVTNALAQAADGLEVFLKQFKKELSFYIGALNLHEKLMKIHQPICYPVFTEYGCRNWKNLYDGSLALMTGGNVVGNTITADKTDLYLITGANQGGKTTFLRSVGQCQLMAQCGLFVCAEACGIPIKTQLYTHFKSGEDSKMDSGKLDEELKRMSDMIDFIHPGAMILFNESFSSTNEREGSEIFRQITGAMLERKIEIFSVTHLMSYALAFADREETICLRAERKNSGERTFRMIIGKPLSTAFGEDIYKKVFGQDKK